MQKAILVGNGFSSQLITSYKDSELVKKMDSDPIIKPIRERYCKLLSQFSGKTDIIDELKKLGFPNPSESYDTYFEKYNLKGYIGKTDIGSIETLLKIGQLFSEIQLTEPAENDTLRTFACTYYWNDGANGLMSIGKLQGNQFNSEKFTIYLNTYGYVFTTNYDTILDDAYDGTVAHLHGSFLMNKDGTIRNDKKNCSDSLLIWGVDDTEKIGQIQAASRAHCWNSPGFRWNDGIRFNTKSFIDKYFAHLATGSFSELDIVGYSGENDKHINSELAKNSVLKQINFYCKPDQVCDQDYQAEISGMFDDKFSVNLICWNKFWNKFMEGNTLCQTNDLN